MAGYQGDFRLGDTLDIKFCTVATTGAPTTLAGTPVVSAYPGNSTTELTAGITLSVDFDSRTGLHNVRVVASSGNGYATATNYSLVLTTGTVGGTSVVGYEVGSFSIENRSAVMPTTAARTLDVSAGGEAGVDWANVGSPTTSLALSATTIAVTQKVDVDTIKTNPVVNGGTITFPTTATLASTTNITAGTVTTATNLTNAPTSGDFTAVMKTSIGTAVAASAVASVTGNVGGNVTGSVGSVATGGITRASLAADTGLQSLRSNTAQAGAGTTITLDASASAVNSFYNNALLVITGGTGVGQARFITAYVGATKVATVATWGTNPDNTSTFAIMPFDAVAGASAPTAAQVATAVWQDATGSDFTTTSSIGKRLTDNIDSAITSRMATYTQPTGFLAATFPAGTVANTTNITAGTITTATNLTNAPTSGDFTATMKTSIGTAVAASAVASVTGNVGGNVTGSVGSVVGAVGSVTGNVGGNVTGSVGSLTTNNDKTGYSIASGGIGSGAHAAAELNAIADALLDRNMATGADNGTNSTVVRTVRQALRRLRNKEAIAAGTGTVYKEDDSTTSFTYAAATTAGDPLSSVDPT